MNKINQYIKKNYSQGQETNERENANQKALTFEMDLDYVIRSVTENLKTDEAHYQENVDRIHKVSFRIL